MIAFAAWAAFNKGIGGETAKETADRLAREIEAGHPDLVIWQFGSNGLLRGRSLPEMEAAARTGIGRLKAAGVEGGSKGVV